MKPGLWFIFLIIWMAIVIPVTWTGTANPDVSMSTGELVGILIAATVFIAFLALIFMNSKLSTVITEEGIRYRYPPSQNREKLIHAPEIERYEIRTFKPAMEYGGHGAKKSQKWGQSFTVRGNTGLQLYLKDGTRILIGTQRKDAIMRAMGRMKKGIP